MNVNNLKNKVGGKKEAPVNEKEDFKKLVYKKLIPKVLPLLEKYGYILAILLVSIFLQFVYALFSHTKEVLISVAISTLIILLPKWYLSTKLLFTKIQLALMMCGTLKKEINFFSEQKRKFLFVLNYIKTKK